MNVEICDAVTAPGELVMGVLYFLHRNARIALGVALCVGALGAAGAIGWVTAPV